MILISIVFIISSCDYSDKIATFHIFNNSQFQITGLQGSFSPVLIEDKDILEPGESCTMIQIWHEVDISEVYMEFSMNGEEYGTREWIEAMTDLRRFKLSPYVENGDTVIVYIFDGYWEWQLGIIP
ncbi:MAG: hypothetical protein LBV43_14140 [Prevotella sp.]|jgi:hypothetical protein|nr:hypothetical protein [Prevotella sp.]